LWLGEAEMGRRNFEAALQYFQAATTELSASNSEPLHDDFRCQLAISQSKSGRAFLMLGKTVDAEAAFRKALETSNPSLGAALQDVPAYYQAADAYAGLGDATMKRAQAARSSAERAKLLRDARDSYEKSIEYWQKIPNPSRISPGVFLVQNESEVARDLARSKAELAAMQQKLPSPTI